MLKRWYTELRMLAGGHAASQLDVTRAVERLRKEVLDVGRAVEELAAAQQAVFDRAARMERDTQQIRSALWLNEAQRATLNTLDTRLDSTRITAHVRDAIDRAALLDDPFPHTVVENLLPQDVYELALAAIPPKAFFNEKERAKQNIRIPMEFAPTLSMRVWEFIDGVVARDTIRPAALAKFHEPLQRHYDAILGPGQRERAAAAPQSTSGGRLMLRRAGYHLDPHRDPKRTLLTCLIYLARRGDSEKYGTQIFRVEGDHEATYAQTYYPGLNGGRCELVKLVPFRPNTALIFLNSTGAHGADIPADASKKVERSAFQFYIGPDREAFDRLVADLPAERRAMWTRNKPSAASDDADEPSPAP